MKTLFTLLLTLFTSFCFSQNLNYRITTAGNNIGELSVNYNFDNKLDLIEVKAESKVSFRLIKKIELSYQLYTIFKEGNLKYSSVTTYVNGSEHSKTTTEKRIDDYKVINKGHTSLYLKPITYSGALLYFEEPIEVNSDYSEIEGIEKKITKIDIHTYRITDSRNGQIADYYYKDGILESAIIHHSIMNFRLTKF